MRLFLVHNSLSAAVRDDTFDGRPFLVAPVVAVKAGVLNGELLLADEINHFVEAWNNRPIMLTHPVNAQGAPISANAKPVLEAMSFGMLLNCAFKDNGLLGEIWIDLGKAKQLGGDAMLCVERLRTQQPIEVSTGYWCDPEPKSGTFNGQKYTAIQHNLRPDHLALLPHDLGACSWQDGCGVPRVNVACTCQQQKKDTPVKENWLLSTLRSFLRSRRKPLTENIQQSADDIEDALQDALNAAVMPGPYAMVCIEDFYPDSQLVIYYVCNYGGDMGMSEGPLYQRSYTLDANGMATLGDPVEVVEETRYLPVTANADKTEDEPSDNLIANILSTARTPDYSGTETSSWGSVDKSLGAYATACTHAMGSECSGAVGSMSSEQKHWIASKSLLGDPAASTASDLIFFPVVNPRTNKLNEGALHAVISGRGAQAKIPDSAKTSAQNKARSLLAKEFHAEPTTQQQQQQGDDGMDKKTMVAAILKANSLDPAAEAGLLLLPEEQLQKLMPVAEEQKKEEPTQQAAQPAANADTLEVMGRFAALGQQERAHYTQLLINAKAATAETCAKMSLAELQTLVASFVPQAVNYAGVGFPRTNTTANQKPKAPPLQSPFPIGVGWVKANGQRVGATVQHATED
jgi:hypothetical protein